MAPCLLLLVEMGLENFFAQANFELLSFQSSTQPSQVFNQRDDVFRIEVY
jgi:hypothetical protein